MQYSLVNLIIDLERPLEKDLKKKEYQGIKYHNTPVIVTLDPMRLTSPTMEEDHLKGGLSRKTDFSRPYMAKASV